MATAPLPTQGQRPTTMGPRLTTVGQRPTGSAPLQQMQPQQGLATHLRQGSGVTPISPSAPATGGQPWYAQQMQQRAATNKVNTEQALAQQAALAEQLRQKKIADEIAAAQEEARYQASLDENYGYIPPDQRNWQDYPGE